MKKMAADPDIIIIYQNIYKHKSNALTDARYKNI